MTAIPLKLLRPRWLSHDGRERVGVDLDCPEHPDGHRVELWFENPDDGGPPARSGAGLVTRMLDDDDALEHLTLLPAGGPGIHAPLEIGHWRGWLVEGELTGA